MIEWLDDLKADDVVKANIDRFRRTSFARDLEDDKASWVWVSWPRSADTPLRFELRGEPHRKAVFTIDGDGREYGSVKSA